jgi:hypothetical protein
MDNRVFKASKVNSHWAGWIADLSPDDAVNPDFYWHFRLRRQARRFVYLVDLGMRSDIAANQVDEEG